MKEIYEPMENKGRGVSMIWIAFVVGICLGSVFTYFVTLHVKKLNAVDERIKAEKMVSYGEGRLASRDELAVEREVYTRRTGVVWKVKSIVISERILLGGLPITPFYEQERRFDEHIDGNELGMAADVVRGLAGLPDLKKMGLRVIQKPLKRVLS